jgi:FAD/FMN-containing dehydrogenase
LRDIATDVSHVVSLARESGLELAIRSGGHSDAGHSTTDGGIVLDLSEMKGIEIDVEGRTAWAETGLTAGEYTAAAGAHGLATGFGDTGSVGIGGITLGGGVGYLVRKHGLTIDDLLAGELKAAAGDHRTAFARYEEEMREYVRHGQKLAKGNATGLIPRSRSQIWIRNQIIRALPYMPWKGPIAGGAQKAANAITLKDYEG